MRDPTSGLFQEAIDQNHDKRYRAGYVDALLDVYLLVKFVNKVEPVYFEEPKT